MLLLAILPLVHAAVVDVGYRQYRGYTFDGLTSWLGIQYAAPPVGNLRFAPPEDPPFQTGIYDADAYGLTCLRTAQDPKYSLTSEDCLYLNVIAPANATSLPVFVYFQGGAFNANTRPHINATTFMESRDFVLVNFNYRVGPWGFLAGRDVTPNNGLRDQQKGLEWVQRHIAKFGGDPDHVVIGGGSAGAASVVFHLMRDEGLFHGAIAQSASFSGKLSVEESQYQYDNFAVRMGCAVENSLACLRNKTTEEIQAKNNFNLPLPYGADPPLYQWLPVMDGDMVREYTHEAFRRGLVARVPTIFGDDTNGGTDFAPEDAETIVDSNLFLANQYPSLGSPDTLARVNELYPNPWTETDRCPGAGCFWRQAADVYGDARFMCPSIFMANAMASYAPSWLYRWNVEDLAQEAAGLGVPHTVETEALFGAKPGESEDDEDFPQSYREGGVNEMVGPVIRAYWTSFIRTLDPNLERLEGTAEWVSGEGRLEFGTGATTGMEALGLKLAERCRFWEENAARMLI